MKSSPNYKKIEADHSSLPWSCHGAGASGSSKPTHGSGLESGYCVCDTAVHELLEQDVTRGWRMKQMVLGKWRRNTAENTVLVFKVSANESQNSPVWKKKKRPPHTFHLWNSAKLWRLTTLDSFEPQNLKCYSESVTSTLTDVIQHILPKS